MESTPNSVPRFRGMMLKKIYTIWLWRRFLPILGAEVAVLTGAMYLLGRSVFIERILDNALRVFFADPPEIVSFALFAFLSAAIVIKILSVSVLALAALLIWKITQGILRYILVKENFFGKVER